MLVLLYLIHRCGNWLQCGWSCQVDSAICVHLGSSLIVECGCCSRGYATHSGTEEDSDQGNSDEIETSQPLPTRKGGGSTAMKKRVELDAQGQPFGAMKPVLCAYIKKFAKDLDPTTGWEGQPRHLRKRLFKRLYTGKVCSPHFLECTPRANLPCSFMNLNF